jgi:hypothetical protein
MVKALPGAMVAAASAMADGDMIRRAAAAMAMQPRAMAQAAVAALSGTAQD